MGHEQCAGIPPAFSVSLLVWYDRVRRELPWRATRDPYAIWVSEVVLQQTRVAQGVGYYERFMARFPDVHALAAASVQEVLAVWQGLGYYSRAIHMHRAAVIIAVERGGRFPQTAQEWQQLPGVGAYTAAAVSSIVFDFPAAVVDGNVLRVMARLSCEPRPVREQAARKRLERLADSALDGNRPGDYNQAVMELGAVCCTPRQPRCGTCPVTPHCNAFQLNLVERFPVAATKKNRKVVSLFYLLYVVPGGLYLCQRGSDSIWKQMWEFKPVDEGQFNRMCEMAEGFAPEARDFHPNTQRGGANHGSEKSKSYRRNSGKELRKGGEPDRNKPPGIDGGTRLGAVKPAPGVIENDVQCRPLISTIKRIEHHLTHRQLNITLLTVEWGIGFSDDSLTFVVWNDLKNYPLPVVFYEYLKEIDYGRIE